METPQLVHSPQPPHHPWPCCFALLSSMRQPPPPPSVRQPKPRTSSPFLSQIHLGRLTIAVLQSMAAAAGMAGRGDSRRMGGRLRIELRTPAMVAALYGSMAVLAYVLSSTRIIPFFPSTLSIGIFYGATPPGKQLQLHGMASCK